MGRACRLLMVVASFLWPAAVDADPLFITRTDTNNFSATNQSLWGSGPAFVYDFSQFYGVSWDKTSGQIGGIDSTVVGDFGVKVGGVLDAGKVGVQVGAHVTSGHWNANMPSSFEMNALTRSVGFGSNPGAIDVFSTINYTDGALQAFSPTAWAFADLIVDAHASVSGEACFFDCVSGSINTPDIHINQELAAINRNNDGQIRLLGSNLGHLGGDFSLGGYVTLSVELPIIDALGIGADTITTHASADVAELSLDVDKLLTTGLGLPPLDGDFGLLSYDLFSANVGVTLGLNQDLVLDSGAVMRFDLSDGDASHTYAPQFLTAGGFGFFNMPTGVDVLTVTPSITYTQQFSNRTYLSINPFIELAAGSFGFDALGYSADVGPLYSQRFDLAEFDIDVFNLSYALSQTHTLAPFTVCRANSSPTCGPALLPDFGALDDPDTIDDDPLPKAGTAPDGDLLLEPGVVAGRTSGPAIPDAAVPEPGTLLLTGSSVMMLVARLRRRSK